VFPPGNLLLSRSWLPGEQPTSPGNLLLLDLLGRLLDLLDLLGVHFLGVHVHGLPPQEAIQQLKNVA